MWLFYKFASQDTTSKLYNCIIYWYYLPAHWAKIWTDLINKWAPLIWQLFEFCRLVFVSMPNCELNEPSSGKLVYSMKQVCECVYASLFKCLSTHNKGTWGVRVCYWCSDILSHHIVTSSHIPLRFYCWPKTAVKFFIRVPGASSQHLYHLGRKG